MAVEILRREGTTQPYLHRSRLRTVTRDDRGSDDQVLDDQEASAAERSVPSPRADPARLARNRELARRIKPPLVVLAIALGLFTVCCIGFGFLEYNNNPVELETLVVVALVGSVGLTALGVFWFLMLGLGALFRGTQFRRTQHGTPDDQ